MSIYAVNGKEPVSVWIPSLDTAGNGTTTLTDLVGTLTGTLTNMDAATDWVADTDAGGIRGLDFDGSNDYVATSAALLGAGDVISISAWIRPAFFGGSGNRQSLFSTRFGDSANSFALEIVSAGGPQTNGNISITQPGAIRFNTSSSFTLSTWQHLMFVKSGSSVVVYRNATSIYSTAGASYTLADNATAKQIGRINAGGLYWNGRLDDLRIFNQELALADAQYLYAGGFGRGVTAGGGGIIPILRQHYAAQGAR
jgi:hypothetical protein